MKQFTLLMAIVGITATGCAQNQLLTRLTARKGAPTQPNRQLARSQTNHKSGLFSSKNKTNASGVKLAAYNGGGCCDDTCCGGGCDDTCCGGCDGGGCGDGRCGDGRCGCNSGNRSLRNRCKRACSACGGRGCAMCCGCNPHSVGYPEPQNFNPSPPTGQVAYPYYTVRGPRDFLRNNPPSIGPY